MADRHRLFDLRLNEPEQLGKFITMLNGGQFGRELWLCAWMVSQQFTIEAFSDTLNEQCERTDKAIAERDALDSDLNMLKAAIILHEAMETMKAHDA